MNRGFGKSVLCVLAALAMALSGCGATQGEAGAFGHVSVALVATSPDGSTYRLPEGVMLMLDSPTFSEWFSLDGEQSTRTVKVPEGTYEASLYFNDEYNGTQWPLERRSPQGAIDTVTATLVTPLPATVTVRENETVGLVLSFQVLKGGKVTFTHGLIDVSMDVEEGATTTRVEADMSASFNAQSAAVYEEAPPVLASRLPKSGDMGLHLTIQARLSGAWAQLNSNWACAPLEVLGLTSGGHTGFSDLVAESRGQAGRGSMCVYSDPSGHYVRMRVSRQGAPMTATFSDLGMEDGFFYTLLRAKIPTQAFDGETLDIDALLGVREVPLRVQNLVYDETNGLSESWYYGLYLGTATLSLVAAAP
jgi:hypothetical protein